MQKNLFRFMLVSLCFLAAVYGQRKPAIRVSPARVKLGENVILTATGFTPNRFLMSHLLKPDGTEYNPLRFRIDANGEFSHKIDTVMMETGTFEAWAEDEDSKVISNRAQFTIN